MDTDDANSSQLAELQQQLLQPIAKGKVGVSDYMRVYTLALYLPKDRESMEQLEAAVCKAAAECVENQVHAIDNDCQGFEDAVKAMGRFEKSLTTVERITAPLKQRFSPLLKLDDALSFGREYFIAVLLNRFQTKENLLSRWLDFMLEGVRAGRLESDATKHAGRLILRLFVADRERYYVGFEAPLLQAAVAHYHRLAMKSLEASERTISEGDVNSWVRIEKERAACCLYDVQRANYLETIRELLVLCTEQFQRS